MIPAPRNQRETFNLLMRLSANQPLEEILELIDWRGVSPMQLYQAVLGRLPEALEQAIPPIEYAVQDHFVEMLKSGEFQAGVINSFIRQFPEGRRLIFVHIPKCAGTDLIHNLSRYHPHMAYGHSQREWIAPEDLLMHLARTSIHKCSSPDLLISGHFSLRYALDNYYRCGDSIFTVIRDPHEIILSHVNYVTNALRNDHPVSRPDTQWWWAQLDRPVLSPYSDQAEWFKLAIQVLHNTEITKADFMCTMLGDGTLEGALTTMGLAPLEIVDVTFYSRWLESRWGIATVSRQNAGIPIVHWHTLPKQQRAYVKTLCQQDRMLYDLFRRVSAGRLAASVEGRDLWYEWREAQPAVLPASHSKTD
jgi:hypothetical protein